jgi:hypothetical protein
MGSNSGKDPSGVPSFRLPDESFVGLNQQKSYRTPTGNLWYPLGKTHMLNRSLLGTGSYLNPNSMESIPF